MVRQFSSMDSRIERTAHSTWCWWRSFLDVIPRCLKVFKYLYNIFINIRILCSHNGRKNAKLKSNHFLCVYMYSYIHDPASLQDEDFFYIHYFFTFSIFSHSAPLVFHTRLHPSRGHTEMRDWLIKTRPATGCRDIPPLWPRQEYSQGRLCWFGKTYKYTIQKALYII